MRHTVTPLGFVETESAARECRYCTIRAGKLIRWTRVVAAVFVRSIGAVRHFIAAMVHRNADRSVVAVATVDASELVGFTRVGTVRFVRTIPTVHNLVATFVLSYAEAEKWRPIDGTRLAEVVANRARIRTVELVGTVRTVDISIASIFQVDAARAGSVVVSSIATFVKSFRTFA